MGPTARPFAQPFTGMTAIRGLGLSVRSRIVRLGRGKGNNHSSARHWPPRKSRSPHRGEAGFSLRVVFDGEVKRRIHLPVAHIDRASGQNPADQHSSLITNTHMGCFSFVVERAGLGPNDSRLQMSLAALLRSNKGAWNRFPVIAFPPSVPARSRPSWVLNNASSTRCVKSCEIPNGNRKGTKKALPEVLIWQGVMSILDKARTCNLRLRRPTLYPIELRGRDCNCLSRQLLRRGKLRLAEKRLQFHLVPASIMC
jgi:hypothetical protein